MADRKLILTISILATFALECSTPMNKPGSTPVMPVSEPSHAPRQFQWSPVAIPYSSRYRVDDSSTVSITNDNTGKEVLLISSAIYSLVLTQGGKLTIDLHIDSASTDTTPRQTQPGPHAIATLSARGQISDLRSTTPTSCGSGLDPRFARLFDLIIPFSPDPVTIGSQWADTSSMIVCHGRIALRQYITRKYRLLAELTLQNGPAIQLERTTVVEMEGEPTDSINLITANGTGSSTASLLLDRGTGKLLENTGTSDLSLSVVTSRGRFPFRQHSKLKIKIN